MDKAHIKIIGARVLARRLKLGISQQTVADGAGVRQPTISDLENGLHSPRIETLVAIAGALGTSLASLVRPYSPPKR